MVGVMNKRFFQVVTPLRPKHLEKFMSFRGLSVGVYETCRGVIAVRALSLRFNPLKNAVIAGALRFSALAVPKDPTAGSDVAP